MKLNVWVILDRKRGHENQTKALIDSLKKFADLKVNNFFASGFLSNFINLFKKKNDQLIGPDLIIGAGHSTHFDILFKKLIHGGKSIVIMKPSIPMLFFDLCIIPKHDHNANRNNIYQTNGPINNIVNKKKQSKSMGLILVGGPSKHYIWDSMFVINAIQKIFEKNKNLKIIVGASRRTPLEFYNQWKEIFKNKIKIYNPDDVSKDWLRSKVEKCKYAWVTQDSISMTYELINAGSYLTCIELQQKTKKFHALYQKLFKEKKLNFISKQNEDLLITHNQFSEADKSAEYIYNKFIKNKIGK